MNRDNLRRRLEADRFYYTRIYEAMRPKHERIRIEKKRIFARIYREAAEMGVRLKAVEAELGYKYDPDEPRVPAGNPDGGEWTSDGTNGGALNDGNNNNGTGNNQDPSGLNTPFQIAGDGDIFENREGLLPDKPYGYYTITVIPTPGVSGPGSQRLVTGSGGEVYYTPDHYKTFERR